MSEQITAFVIMIENKISNYSLKIGSMSEDPDVPMRITIDTAMEKMTNGKCSIITRLNTEVKERDFALTIDVRSVFLCQGNKDVVMNLIEANYREQILKYLEKNFKELLSAYGLWTNIDFTKQLKDKKGQGDNNE